MPTHGEPHNDNQVVTADGVRLVDWESLALAPPERDYADLLVPVCVAANQRAYSAISESRQSSANSSTISGSGSNRSCATPQHPRAPQICSELGEAANQADYPSLRSVLDDFLSADFDRRSTFGIQRLIRLPDS